MYILNKTIKEIETLNTKQKIEYFEKVRQFCQNQKLKNNNILFHKAISVFGSNLRNFQYEIVNQEIIPLNCNPIFVCNHSNSHDFFTSHELFNILGTDVSVLAALNFPTEAR